MSREKNRYLRSRFMLGSAGWVLAISTAQATTPSCSTVSSVYTCTQGAGTFTSAIQIDNVSIDAGDAGLSASLANSGTFNVTAGSDTFVLKVTSTGADGVDDGNGGAGGSVTITSTGALTLTRSDATSELIVIDGRSIGGDADRDNQNNNSDGGQGGAGAAVVIESDAAITLGPSLPDGGIGIYARSQGGDGGEPNLAVGVNRPGGAGGAAGNVTVTNKGTITIGSAAAPITQGSKAWGIRAESDGGGGDPDANSGDSTPASGAGGNAGTVTVTSSSRIDVHVDGTGSTGGGVRGIHASATGGNGAASSYNFDNGGAGGSGGAVTVDLNDGGDISVSSARTLADGGAGVLATSQGGTGGEGNKQDSDGGHGGNGGGAGGITVNVGAAIATQGDDIIGVLAEAIGGTGGAGDDENNSSGGTGGGGGAIQINLNSGGSITTSGDGAYAILGQSIGGTGGAGGDDTALFGSAGSAGAGGNSAAAGAYTTGNTSITTTGDFATGIAFQSIGGGGGVGGDFVDVLGGSGGDGGNGGNGTRSAINSSSTISTSGDNAYGLLAQAIAGSGGAGGIAAGISVELGGDGGEGGTGGTGEILNAGNITTQGYASNGIVLQSIGGGGGAAGSAGGLISVGGNSTYSYDASGGAIDFSNTGHVATHGDAAVGIMAQSIGGGGGTGAGSTGLVSVGGKGSAGGSGGGITIALGGGVGTIATAGEFAHGLLVQSIGGGGGNGGSAFDFSAEIPAIAIGGDAAGGGAGGTVNLSSTTASSITTTGDAAVGMLVQSIGGGGGTGGDATGASLQAQVNLKIGGSGASSPANGGNVTVDLDDLSIGTNQTRSTGMLVQSIGGGGGSGGSASGYDAGVGFAVGVSLGGSGGAGGTGGTVDTHLTGARIITGQALPEGDTGNQPTDTFGIVVQSLGGGGGNGGSATADDLAVLAPTGEDVSFAVSVAVAVGGASGAAGNGGAATVTLDGSSSVTTVGQGSHGVLVQSIGGGGGNGGDSSSLSSTIGDENTWELDVSVDVGRDGGSGGNGGSVNVTVGSGSDATKIITNDDYANAVLAQSIGGGGGNAGVGSSNTYKLSGTASANVDVGVGGKGATGGDGGTVTVHHNNVATITTHGSGSRGILAQSVGGGGGTSQGTTVILGGAASDYSATVNVGVGRSGGSGGVGNKVQVFSVGSITTDGGDADGILAQSIGGGGGLGGSIGNDGSADHQLAEALSLIVDGETTYTLGVAVGGQGGSGGTGGEVDVSSSSAIRTAGDWADGIVAQSVGGGGGVGGTSVASGSFAKADTEVGVGGGGGGAGNGGAVTVTAETSVATAGYSAHGIVAQSIGGGGGQGGDGSDSSNLTVSVGAGSGVGGSGGASGSGGNVTVQVSSGYNLTVSTAGDDAYGIVAQSVGGGGGMGGAGSSKGADKAGSYDFAVTVGGKSGSSGSGGTSTVTGKMGVTTAGDRAFGIVAQSIGGGGGIGGAASSESIVSLDLGGQGGAGGSGGAVAVTLTSGSSVHTSGDGAHAIIAQSIGGGGGIGGDATGGHLDFTPYGSTPNSGGGNGENVAVNVDATIQTTGAGAFGIVAQSIGGGGGIGGYSGGSVAGSTGYSSGNSGTVTVTQAGSITAGGDGSIGIFAQSDAPFTPANISVTVNGAVAGGTGDQGSGVHFDGGFTNSLTVDAGGSISAGSGTAVRFTTSPDFTIASLAITNNGSINGDIDNAGSGSITGDTALVAAASDTQVIMLDNRGTITGAWELDADVRNGGTLEVGERGAIDRTEVAGDLVQTPTGRIVVDLDLGKRSADTLAVAGDATLDGTVRVVPLSLLPGRSADFLSIGGALQGGLEAEASPIFRYAVETAGGIGTVSVASADFRAPAAGGSANQRQVARHLQAAWEDGEVERLGTLFAAIDAQASAGAYGSALSDLSLGVAAAPAARRQATMLGFADSLSSCPVFEDGSAVLREDACMWARVAGARADQDSHNGASGFDEDAISYQLGAQWEVSPDWFLGLAAAYQRDWFDSDDGRSNSDGDSAFAGVSLKRQWGAWQVGGVLSGGYGWYDTKRKISVPGFEAKADSEPELQNLGLRLRTAYDWGQEKLYVRPYLDLDAIYTRQPGYDESGAGDLNLDVRSADQWSLVATPSVEVGGRVPAGEAGTLRPYARLGVALSNQDDWTSRSRLAAAPGGAGDFDSSVPMDEVTAKVGAGLQLTTQRGLELRLQYDGQFSANVTSHGGSLRLALPF